MDQWGLRVTLEMLNVVCKAFDCVIHLYPRRGMFSPPMRRVLGHFLRWREALIVGDRTIEL